MGAFSLRRTVALLLIAIGLFIAAYPFVSVWRVGGEVLSMLPAGSGQTIDDRPALALFDDDFVIATRTYPEAAVHEIEALLADDGFTVHYSAGRSGDAWLVKDCCGSYDAALARIETSDGGMVIAELSVFDSDVQISWWFISALGGLLLFAGLVTVYADGLTRDTTMIREHEALSI